ncbi:MAG: hypothetical protein J2P17_28365 [Mycobacterium sp.]|nr:hypothetical protein [Mycobacterium sp.]
MKLWKANMNERDVASRILTAWSDEDVDATNPDEMSQVAASVALEMVNEAAQEMADATDAEIKMCFRLLMCAVLENGGKLTVNASTAARLDQLVEANPEVGYTTEGHTDHLIIRLIQPGTN